MSQPYDIPLFGEPVPEPGPVRWPLSKRDEEEAAKPRWLRYRGPAVPCAASPVNPPDPRQRCRPVTWLRVTGTVETLFCSQHKQQFLDDEFLKAPRGSQ